MDSHIQTIGVRHSLWGSSDFPDHCRLQIGEKALFDPSDRSVYAIEFRQLYFNRIGVVSELSWLPHLSQGAYPNKWEVCCLVKFDDGKSWRIPFRDLSFGV